MLPLRKEVILIFLYVSWSGVIVSSENSNGLFAGSERMSQNVLLVSLNSVYLVWLSHSSRLNGVCGKCIQDAFEHAHNPPAHHIILQVTGLFGVVIH